MTNAPPSNSDSLVVGTKAKKQSEQLVFVNEDQMVSLFATNCPNAKRFRIHKEFACHYSPILKAAFNSTFVEGQTQEYRFEDQKDDTLHQLVFWLYTQKLDVISLEPGAKQNLSHSFGELAKERLQMAQLWVLGDKLLIRPLQNSALERLSQFYKAYSYHSTLCYDSLSFIYKSTVNGSLLRKYVTRYYARLLDLGMIARSRILKLFPLEMLVDIILLKSETLVGKDKISKAINWTDYKVAED